MMKIKIKLGGDQILKSKETNRKKKVSALVANPLRSFGALHNQSQHGNFGENVGTF